MKSRSRDPVKIRDINVIDVVLMDHRFLKGCITTLLAEDADKNLKLAVARNFLSILKKHFDA